MKTRNVQVPARPAADVSRSGLSAGSIREQIQCPVCQVPGVSSGISAQALSGRPQHFLRCSTCQTLFDQNPESFEYEQGFYKDNPFLDPKLYLEKGASPRLFGHLVLQAERALAFSQPGRKRESHKGMLWEAGCGAGLLLDMAQFLGWQVFGVEPSPEAASFARDVLQIPISQELLRRRPPIKNTDIVIATEVIEHLESPWDMAAALCASLKPTGVALLTTPNAESKVLSDRGNEWVHLGMGYHLVLYSARALEQVLRRVGFQTVVVGTFEGPYRDERLLVIASKHKVPPAVLQTVLSIGFEEDQEALSAATRYLWWILRRFEHEKHTYWQGAFFRLVETLVAARDFGKALDVANQLDSFLQSQGCTHSYVLDCLAEALQHNDRRIFYAKVPTFIGNLYFLRGLALLQLQQAPQAIEDLRRACAIMEKLGNLPYKAYEEMASLPPALDGLFHLGYAHLRLGQPDEASATFDRILGMQNRLPPETLAHVLLNQSEALQQLGLWEEALSRLQQIPSLNEKGRVPSALLGQAGQKSLEIKLQVQEITRRALQETRDALEAALEETRQTLEAEITHLHRVKEEVVRELERERALRQALEFRLGELRHRMVDKLNSGFKARMPRFHRLTKSLATRLTNWRSRIKKNKIERPRRITGVERGRRTTSASVQRSPRIPLRLPKPVTAEIAACTIIAKNHLSKARVLVDSFLRHHPGCPFFVLLVDRVDAFFQPEKELFHIIEAEQLNIPNPKRFFFHYNVLESSTACKPYFLKHLLENHKLKTLFYFDPDILVTNDMSALACVPDEFSFLLTPHLTAPYWDTYRPSEFDILQAGTYNLGFLGVRNTEVAHRMLTWWQDRLYDKCIMAPELGWHVDQKWVDLVPGLFGGVFVVREPGYNVAYWNLHERRMQVKGKEISVNEQPCYFFHFSGYDPSKPKTVSKHQNRFRMQDIGDARTLFDSYRELVLAADWAESGSWPYSYDYFDNGARLSPIIRQVYRALGDEASRFGDPFSTQHSPNFFEWLNEGMDEVTDPAQRITRLWYEVYQQRPDVRAAYPEVFGAHRQAFLEWILRSGQVDFSIDPSFILHNRTEESAGEGMPAREALPPAPEKVECPTMELDNPNKSDLPFGANVAGYVTSEKGVGAALRAGVRALAAAGLPYVINTFEDRGSENTESQTTNLASDNPYGINLVYVNADQVPVFHEQKNGYFLNRHNIGCWNWELASFPLEWQASFKYFNEIWVPSSFVQEAVARVSPIPVVRVPYAINPDRSVPQGSTRARLELPSNSFVFLYLFDFHSYAERKNPMGLIRAFKQAFGDKRDVLLLIKCSHSSFAPRTLARLQEECCGANIRIYDAVLPGEAVYGLMSLCDCYVSLHRSEGFGLTLTEAMSLGKPVIATAYSGNMDFMTPGNSFPVRYRLVEIEEDHGPYRKGWVWADPEVEHAAELMRHVHANQEQASAVGRRAREDVNRSLHPSIVGRMIRERLTKSNERPLQELTGVSAATEAN